MTVTDQLGLFDGRSSGGVSARADPATTPLAIRESRRARNLTLRLLPPHTLELVVPHGTKPAEVAAFVAEHRGWIERARDEIAARYPAAHESLPTHVVFPCIGRSWHVRYRHNPGGRPQCRANADLLDVRTREAEHGDAARLLRSWLLDQARAHLRPWLLHEAETVGKRPSAVQVRVQRTRWGSCSNSAIISLNAGLMFLDAPLVRYLMIHELCHLFALNHSRRFWSAVARYEPDYRELDRRLGESWAEIPLWAHARP
jgi:predicted metal-dependent hydrolase